MAILQFIFDRLSHKLVSNSRHGIHSPFVYKLIDEVIYDFTPKNEYRKLEKLRKRLLNDISFAEPGVSKGNFKVYNKLYNGYYNTRSLQLVYRLAQRFNPENILELGNPFGITASCLALANRDVNVISVIETLDLTNAAIDNLKELEVNTGKLLVANSERSQPQFLDQQRLDFIFIDQTFKKDIILNYLEQILSAVHDDSIVIINGIYSDDKMKGIWKELKMHPRVSISLDLFWMGLVFFKKRRTKEHFKISF